jgi:hypothetical protein
MAHFAIDVAGDFLLARDSYDNLRHGSRELLTGLALVLAVLLAGRGLKVCCEIATRNRGRLTRPTLGLREAIGLIAGAVTASIVFVPGMELLDARLDGAAVPRLADAFGGSIPLGLTTTLLCASVVALLVVGAVRWLVSHHDSIATMLETLLRRITDVPHANGYDVDAQRFTPRHRRAPNALRLAKRGPPATSFA